jgi:DNA-binding NarL/FixJ family response regulator
MGSILTLRRSNEAYGVSGAERCQSAGVKAYLLKPVQEDTLIAAIKAATVS